MTIRSQPAGALVYVDDYEIGTTPVSTNFTYYGTRKIRLVKDGYETLTVMQPVPAPWYQIPPLDFVSENLIPGRVRDRRELCYQMTPQLVVPTEQLLERAEALRSQTRLSGVPASSPPLDSPPASTPWSYPSSTIALPPPPTGPYLPPGSQPGEPAQESPGPAVSPGLTLPPGGWSPSQPMQ